MAVAPENDVLLIPVLLDVGTRAARCHSTTVLGIVVVISIIGRGQSIFLHLKTVPPETEARGRQDAGSFGHQGLLGTRGV